MMTRLDRIDDLLAQLNIRMAVLEEGMNTVYVRFIGLEKWLERIER